MPFWSLFYVSFFISAVYLPGLGVCCRESWSFWVSFCVPFWSFGLPWVRFWVPLGSLEVRGGRAQAPSVQPVPPVTERRLSWFSATLGPCRLSRQLGAHYEACPQVPLPYHSKRCVLYASLLPPRPCRPSVGVRLPDVFVGRCPPASSSLSSSSSVRVVVVCPSVCPPVRRRRPLLRLSSVHLSSPGLVRCGVPPSPLGFSFCLKDALVASFPSFLSLPPPFHPAKRCGSSAMPAPTRTTSEIRGLPTCTKDSKHFQKMPRPG